MGKKIKKALGGVKKLAEKLDPLGAGLLNPIADSMSDQYLGTDWSGNKAAAAQLQRDQLALQEAANNIQRNANVDLGLDNVTVAQVGGTADATSTAANRRRTRAAGNVASSLGINA